MRSATKHMLWEAIQWGALALGIVAVIYFFDDLRTVFRPNNALPTLAEAMRDRRPNPRKTDRALSGRSNCEPMPMVISCPRQL